MWDSGQLPNQYTTDPIPWNAAYTDIYSALINLPNLAAGSIQVSGGPLPFNDITIKFIGAEAGFPQQLITIDGTNLEGGGFLVESRVQSGDTSYTDSESDSIYVNNKTILLEDSPVSNDSSTDRSLLLHSRALENENPVSHFFCHNICTICLSHWKTYIVMITMCLNNTWKNNKASRTHTKNLLSSLDARWKKRYAALQRNGTGHEKSPAFPPTVLSKPHQQPEGRWFSAAMPKVANRHFWCRSNGTKELRKRATWNQVVRKWAKS